MPGALNGFRKQTLMRRADSTDSPGQYFPAFGNKVAQKFSILEIDIGYFFRAKFTYSFASNSEPFLTWHSSQPFYLEGSGVFSSRPTFKILADLRKEFDPIRLYIGIRKSLSALSGAGLP
jgi:hypothetical protein